MNLRRIQKDTKVPVYSEKNGQKKILGLGQNMTRTNRRVFEGKDETGLTVSYVYIDYTGHEVASYVESYPDDVITGEVTYTELSS